MAQALHLLHGEQFAPVKQPGDLGRNLIGGNHQSGVEVDVALCHPPWPMPEQAGDRQFAEPERCRNARKGVAQDMRRHFLQASAAAYSVENTDDADEMAVTSISREDVGRRAALPLSH